MSGKRLARRTDQDREGHEDRRDLQEPGESVLDPDRRQTEEGQGHEEQHDRFAPAAGGLGDRSIDRWNRSFRPESQDTGNPRICGPGGISRLARGVLFCLLSRKGSLSPTKIIVTAALFLVAVGAGGCGSSAYARRRADDARLSALVEQRLTTTAGLSASRVRAKSHWGVVALVGEVPEEQLREDAGQLAVGVPGSSA